MGGATHKSRPLGTLDSEINADLRLPLARKYHLLPILRIAMSSRAHFHGQARAGPTPILERGRPGRGRTKHSSSQRIAIGGHCGDYIFACHDPLKARDRAPGSTNTLPTIPRRNRSPPTNTAAATLATRRHPPDAGLLRGPHPATQAPHPRPPRTRRWPTLTRCGRSWSGRAGR